MMDTYLKHLTFQESTGKVIFNNRIGLAFCCFFSLRKVLDLHLKCK